MARQGHAFATAEEVRVVYPLEEGNLDGPLVDVPRDGKTVGEIVTRGNIVMREVRLTAVHFKKPNLISILPVFP